MLGFACPSRRETCPTLAPCAIKSDAAICRRSCQRSFGSPAASSAGSRPRRMILRTPSGAGGARCRSRHRRARAARSARRAPRRRCLASLDVELGRGGRVAAGGCRRRVRARPERERRVALRVGRHVLAADRDPDASDRIARIACRDRHLPFRCVLSLSSRPDPEVAPPTAWTVEGSFSHCASSGLT